MDGENVISFTVENTITVGIMALVFFVAFHFLRAQMGYGGMESEE